VPISEPRGLPSRVSHTVSSADNLYIVEKDSNESGTCTQEQAARWIASGSSKLVREKVVTNPDHHSYSWVSLSEFERAISELTSIIKYKLSVEYYAVLSAMKIIAEQGYEVRLVFWFDN
jgi:6-pyruvoyl-tetrahydropterin synthase